jgi:hypothetical protein
VAIAVTVTTKILLYLLPRMKFQAVLIPSTKLAEVLNIEDWGRRGKSQLYGYMYLPWEDAFPADVCGYDKSIADTGFALSSALPRFLPEFHCIFILQPPEFISPREFLLSSGLPHPGRQGCLFHYCLENMTPLFPNLLHGRPYAAKLLIYA